MGDVKQPVGQDLGHPGSTQLLTQLLLTWVFVLPRSPVLQVNIIPIIAKADTISKSELHKFKIKIMSELVSNGVQIYQFPTDDEAVAEINSVMNVGNAATSIAAKSWDN